MKQTVRDKVVLNAFILEVKIDVGNCLKVFQTEVRQFIGLFAAVESDNQRSVESVVTEELKLFSVVIPSQRLFV